MTMLTLNDERAELWQWETGRTLSVDVDCSQVHFSNKVFGRSIDVDVAGGVAIIPDILLQTDKDLNVWAFVGTAENGYTKISKTFKVNRRNKPSYYVFTPTEQTTLGELSQRIDKIEESQDVTIKNAVEEYLEQNPVVPDLSNYATKDEIPDVSGFATKAEIPVVPKALPNPNALTFTGAVNATYDGSTAVSVEIPSGGSGGTDISLGLISAAVGQTIKVKAVDESGKPTAWDAADVGGWELITDITLTEDGGGASLNVTSNDKGENFEYRQCMVCLSGKVIDGWPKGAYISLELYESNKLTGSKASISLSRLAAGAGGTEYKTTVEISIFGNLVRIIACGGSSDTSSLIMRSESSIDTFRSIKIYSYGNNQWVSVPFAAGGRAVIYGRK